jgi:hypothetical protein
MRGTGGGAAATTMSSSSRLPAAAPGSAQGARQQQQQRCRPAHPSGAGDADADADAAVTSSSSSSSPSLFQLVAMARCYRTMVPTWMWLPKQLLVWPSVVALALRAVRPFRGGSSSSSGTVTGSATTATRIMMMLAAATAILFLWLRKKLLAASSLSPSPAPSPSTRIQVPRRQPPRRIAFVGFVVVAVGAAICQVVASLLASLSSGAAAEPETTTTSMAESLVHTAWASLRWSLAAALLGWTVLGRYTGPRSCHRMSSCLLGAFPPPSFSICQNKNSPVVRHCRSLSFPALHIFTRTVLRDLFVPTCWAAGFLGCAFLSFFPFFFVLQS